MPHTVNLNADLGESFGAWEMGSDADMLATVNSANIACGFHAGDPLVMRRTLSLARKAGVSVGETGRAAWGLRKADVELRKALDAYLDNLRSGPSWNRLIVVYFGEKALSALGRAR